MLHVVIVVGVVVAVVARLISGLVVEPPDVAGPEVTAVVAALPAEEEIKAPAVVEGVDAIPSPPGEAEVGLRAPEAFSASRVSHSLLQRSLLHPVSFLNILCPLV